MGPTGILNIFYWYRKKSVTSNLNHLKYRELLMNVFYLKREVCFHEIFILILIDYSNFDTRNDNGEL